MFGIGFFEMIIILLLLVLVVGPEQLPGALRKGAAFMREARRHLSEIRDAVERETDAISQPIREVGDQIGQITHASESGEQGEKGDAVAVKKPSGSDGGDA